jgi:cell volume regulation protein A
VNRSAASGKRPPRLSAASRDSISQMEIASGDLVYVITTDEHMRLLDHLFVPADDAEESEQQRVFGTFTLDGDAPLGEVAETYGVEIPEQAKSQTLARHIDRQFHRRPVVGDFVSIGRMNLVVREIQGRSITKVGIVVSNR